MAGNPDRKDKEMKLDKLLLGKTICEASYNKYEYVVLRFTDGSVVYINQISQTGELQVDYNQSIEVEPDDRED